MRRRTSHSHATQLPYHAEAAAQTLTQVAGATVRTFASRRSHAVTPARENANAASSARAAPTTTNMSRRRGRLYARAAYRAPTRAAAGTVSASASTTRAGG